MSADADRIAQLTAELAKVRKRNDAVWDTLIEDRESWMQISTDQAHKLDELSAAHERTKTELIDMRTHVPGLRTLENVIRERDAAREERYSATTNLSIVAHQLAESEAARTKAEGERDAAQGEAAAMHDVLKWARKLSAQNKTKRQHARASQTEIELAKAVERVNGIAGRILAERVTLWRELELKAHVVRQGHDTIDGGCHCGICELSREFDNKEPTDG